MPTPYTDFLNQVVGGVLVPWPNVWVRYVSNNSGAAFVSTAATTALGKFTFTTIPGDVYTVYTGPTSIGAWTANGNTSAAVAYVAGDNAVFQNVTIDGPKPWIDITAPSVTVGVTTYTLGADPTGVLDSAPARQNCHNAILANLGGIEYIPPGTFKHMSTVQVKQSGCQIFTSGAQSVLIAGTTGIDLIYALNLKNLWIGDIFLDGQWQSTVSGIRFDGVQNSRLGIIWCDRILGDTPASAGWVCQASAAAIAPGCVRNMCQSLMVLNGGRGWVCNGSSTAKVASNNTIFYLEVNGRSNGVSVNVDFQNNADSNSIYFADLTVAFAGSSNVIWNSGVPASNNGVYENHILKCMCSAGGVAGQSSLVVNKTERISWVQFRPSLSAPDPTINTGGLLGLLQGSISANDNPYATHAQNPTNPVLTGQTAAVAAVFQITSPNDARKHAYRITGHINITVHGTEAITLLADYTDDGGTVRTRTFTLVPSSGVDAVAANALGPWTADGLIVVNPGTVITLRTGGTFTGATYNCSGFYEPLNT